MPPRNSFATEAQKLRSQNELYPLNCFLKLDSLSWMDFMECDQRQIGRQLKKMRKLRRISAHFEKEGAISTWMEFFARKMSFRTSHRSNLWDAKLLCHITTNVQEYGTLGQMNNSPPPPPKGFLLYNLNFLQTAIRNPRFLTPGTH